MVRHFDTQSFLRVEKALTAEQIHRFDQAVDQLLKEVQWCGKLKMTVS